MASVIYPSSQEERLQFEEKSPIFPDQYSSKKLYQSTVNCKQALRRVKKTRRYTLSEGTPKRNRNSIDGIIEDLDAFLDNDYRRPNSGSMLPCGKNSRKPRNGFGCKSKKNYDDGRGMMIKVGMEMAELTLQDLDFNDPNYDSDEENIHLQQSEPKPISFEKHVEIVLKEYYDHGDAKEVMLSLEDGCLTSDQYSHLLQIAITLAIERRPRHCEMTSKLLSASMGKFLSIADVEQGFNTVLRELPDLALDVPAAPELLGRFIARAVADDVLPPKYVHSYKGKLSCPLAVRALSQAENLLLMKHAYTRLDNVWGLSGAHISTKVLRKRVKLLLDEYVSSNDKDEATMCVRELDVPHYHHEVVYQTMIIVLEKGTVDVCKRMGSLLSYWSSTAVVTDNQMILGFKRIYGELDDICIDIPNALIYLEHFLKTNQQNLPKELLREMPVRPRKRFVSEGDPAVFKETSLHHY